MATPTETPEKLETNPAVDQPGDESPGESSGALSINDFGKNNRDLPDQLKKAILQAVRDCQDQDKYNRRVEVVEDAKHRYYDMQIQYVYLNSSNCWTQALPGGVYNGTNGEESFGDYLDVYDIFHRYATIPQAKLSENAPGIDFQPVNPDSPEDRESSSAAEGMRHDFDRNNDNKKRQRETVYHFEMGGRCVRWTRTEESLQKYGTNNDGTPRRASVATNYGVLESKLPIFSECVKDFPYCILYDDPDIKIVKEKYHWLRKKLTKGSKCLNESEYERIARLGVVQSGRTGRNRIEVGDSLSHLITRGNIWLRLSNFIECEDAYVSEEVEMTPATDDEDEHAKTVYEKLKELFPDGIHAVVVGDQYAESWNQSMDDRISVGHAMIGKGQTRMPMMRPVVQFQNRVNTTCNYIAQCFDYGAVSVYIDAENDEYAAITKQHASPFAFRQLKSRQGGSLADQIHQTEQPEIAESMLKYLEMMTEAFPQNELAVPPSIWGGGEEHNETKGGRQLAATQAMEVLGIYWATMAQMDAEMYYHNCLAIMNDPDFPEQITIPGQGGQNTVVRVASLKKGNFRAFPDTESGFPESTATKRATLTQVLNSMPPGSPIEAQIMGSPKNVAGFFTTYGMPEIEIPEAKSYDKQLREIETLLSQPPMLAPEIVELLQSGTDVPTLIKAITQAQATGAAMVQQQQQEAMVTHAAQSIQAQAGGAPMPPVPQIPPFDPTSIARSSVQVWESDYHIWEAKECRDWLTDTPCNTELTIGRESADPQDGGEMKPNVAGVLNVYLHWKEHEAMAAQQAPATSGPLPAPNVKPPVAVPQAAPSALAV